MPLSGYDYTITKILKRMTITQSNYYYSESLAILKEFLLEIICQNNYWQDNCALKKQKNGIACYYT